MIEELRLRGLGVIEDAVLTFAPGLTVVTGETGAGKTMVVTGLTLLFGGRADSGAVRTGTDLALVEGRVVLAAGHAADEAARERAIEAGADLEDGVLLLARQVSAEGRSRAWVGGRSAPVGVLAELAENLVEVHGQSDQQRLLRPERQREALDRYAGEVVTVPLARYREAYDRHRAVEAELRTLAAASRERVQEAERLRFGLAEIDAARPAPGEDVELAVEAERLTHADQLRTAAETAHDALVGARDSAEGSDVSALAAVARRALEQVRGHDPALGAIADRLAEIALLAADVAGDLASYAAGVDADPNRLTSVQERRAALKSLTRKYGEPVDEVLAWAEAAERALTELDEDGTRREDRTAERDQLDQELKGLAQEIGAARRQAAIRFGAAVTGELADLAMPHAVVTLDLQAGELGPHGADVIDLLLAPHPGAPARPLGKGASGGELSRVMLAVEVVFAGADPVPTFVFDEVDAGVGGRAAVEVGRRLALLARTAQVLVVTHLPQVAAFADHHLVVEKTSSGSVTRSGITALDRSGRVEELTRMLAGLDASESGRAHAEELLAAADLAKSPGQTPGRSRGRARAR